MYRLKSEASFDSAHFLKGYAGKCAHIHGHRWRIICEVRSEHLHEEGQLRGMVVDFKDIKTALKDLADRFDHKLVYESGTLKVATVETLLDEGFDLLEVPFRPTAECLSKHFYDLLKADGFDVDLMTVYETPNNSASYSER